MIEGLYGKGLFGDSLEPPRSSVLGKSFLLPPFSVLNTREGWWQERKSAWASLGIEGEIGSRLDKNSLVKLRAFRNRKEEGLRGVIQRNMDRDLPSFAEEWVQTPFGTSSTSLYKFPTRAGQQQPQSGQAPLFDTSTLDAELKKRGKL